LIVMNSVYTKILTRSNLPGRAEILIKRKDRAGGIGRHLVMNDDL